MEVINPTSSLLTNAEVLEVLKEAKEAIAKRPKSKDSKENFHKTLVYETIRYLQDSPASTQRRKDVVNMMNRLKARFSHLTAAEMVQIANLRPRSPVEVQLVVEECEERMTEEEVEELIEIVASTLPARTKQSAAKPESPAK